MEESTEHSAPVMSLGDWALTLLITFLPLIGFVMLIYWSVGSSVNPNKQNWAKAMLILYFMVFVLYLLLGPGLFHAFLPG